ncbi:hypothetical protein C8A00DRAFT_40918 [Chaetomidium leptoderma]|uniref:Uncharacterized protein n=1 Tax=Chaetomidium leptoderma TaxID=669021 RepID=A0AAN6VTI8_9PEZI|nr:hypothetical protein C8A00DRAFT_40918 [Chaetomidium leptoderma]
MGHDIATTINYYNDPGDGTPPTPVYVGSTQVTNERPMIPVTVTVTDVSGREDQFTLDTHGFQYHTRPSAEEGFYDEHTIRTNYYPECEQLLKDVTCAALVLPFGHQVRRGPAHWHSLGQNNTNSRGPLHRAHVDQSYDGAVLRLREQFPDPAEAEKMMKGRWQIINAALADATTVPDTDLVAASIIHTKTGRQQESWTVKPCPEATAVGGGGGHRWYFRYRQMPEQVVLIKCFDSDETVKARRAVHCAVEDSGAGSGGNRESVEVRCLVFY